MDYTICPGVAFSAGVANNQSILLHGEKVVFGRKYAEIGGGYDSTTGVFTSPVSGLFVFEVTSLAEQSKYAFLDLFHNTNYIISLYGHKNDCDYGSGSNAIILDVNAGDQVYVRARDSRLNGNIDIDLYGRQNETYSTFTGYLIRSHTCGN